MWDNFFSFLGVFVSAVPRPQNFIPVFGPSFLFPGIKYHDRSKAPGLVVLMLLLGNLVPSVLIEL